MNAVVILLAVLATYGLSSNAQVSGYVALSGSEFEALDNPLGQFGVRYSMGDADGHLVDLFYDHISGFSTNEDDKGLNRIGILYRHPLDGWHRLAGWIGYASASVRERQFDYHELRSQNTLFMEAGVERKIGELDSRAGRFTVSLFAGGLYGGDPYLHSGLRVSY